MTRSEVNFIVSQYGMRVNAIDFQDCIERMDADEFDLVAIGRALLANSDWANQVHGGHFDQLKAFDKSVLENLV